jgi:hypothetical protein
MSPFALCPACAGKRLLPAIDWAAWWGGAVLTAAFWGVTVAVAFMTGAVLGWPLQRALNQLWGWPQ